MWNLKGSGIAKTMLRKEQTWRSHSSHFQDLLQVTVIKTEWHLHRLTVRWNRIESPENTLCDTIVTDTCRYTFVKTHSMHNTKREP